MGRAENRKQKKALHHNVFTKKYKSDRAKQSAFMNLVGEKTYHELRKKVADKKRAEKAKKKQEVK